MYQYEFREVLSNRTLRNPSSEQVGTQGEYDTIGLQEKDPIDPKKHILVEYDLLFRTYNGHFFHNGDTISPPDNADVKGWYVRRGDGDPSNGQFLELYAFDVTADEFLPANTNFVTGHDGNPVVLTVKGSTSVTVKHDLPESHDFRLHSGSHDIVMTTTDQKTKFDEVFVAWGTPTVNGDTVTATSSCVVICWFETETSTSSVDIGTFQYSKIPWWEWQMAIQRGINELVDARTGAIYEHIPTSDAVRLDRNSLAVALRSIEGRMHHLDAMKHVLSDLHEMGQKEVVPSR